MISRPILNSLPISDLLNLSLNQLHHRRRRHHRRRPASSFRQKLSFLADPPANICSASVLSSSQNSRLAQKVRSFEA